MNDLSTLKLNLVRNRLQPTRLFTDVKSSLTISDIVKLSEDQVTGKILNQAWGDLFPKTVVAFEADWPTYYTENIVTEWKFLLAGCIVNKNKLKQFIVLKSHYEKAILAGKLEDATIILINIQSEFGESLWLFNSLLQLEERKGGTEQNWNKLAEIGRDKDSGIIRFIIEAISKRNEAKIGYFDYLNSIDDQIKSFPLDDETKSFLCYVTSLKDKIDPIHYTAIIYFYSKLPLVDRYVFINTFLIQASLKIPQEIFKLLVYQLKHFNKHFPENIVSKNILQLEGHLPVNKADIDFETIRFFESIIQKDFKTAEASLKTQLETRFSAKQIIDYNIYLASHTSEDAIQFEKHSLINELNNLVKAILQKEGNFGDLLAHAKKTYLQLEDYDSMLYFHHFISREISIVRDNPRFAFNTLLGEPLLQIDSIYTIEQTKGNFRKIVLQEVESSSCKAFYECMDEDGDFKFLADEYIDAKYCQAKILESKGDHNSAMELYKSIISSDSSYHKGFAILDLIDLYNRVGDYRASISFVGKLIIEEPNFLYRIRLEYLCELIEDKTFDTVDDLIYTPIIFSKSNIDSHSVYVALDTFLTSSEKENPLELISGEIPVTHEFIYLLFNVCTIDVLKYFTVYENIQQVEDARINILKYISTVEDIPASVKQGLEPEIVELSQREIIRRGLTNYNRGKISLNAFQLRKYLIDKIAPSYQRFKVQNEFSKHSDFQSIDYDIVDSHYKVVLDLNSIGKLNTLVSLKDPSYISFKHIFNEIREVFLFSKEYGLDGLLSTRIRHGVLVNHIKKIFFSTNLLSIKEDGEYQDIQIWNQYYTDRYPHIVDELQKQIKILSQEIDSYCNSLRLDYIQIKTEKNPEKEKSLFDFSISTENIVTIYAIARDQEIHVSEFADFIMNYLIGSTLKQLEKVRKFISESVRDNLRQHLETFRHKAQSIFYNYQAPDLFAAINLASANISQELNLISQWFQLTEEDITLELTLVDLVHLTVKVLSVLHPNYILTPKIYCTSPIKIIYAFGLVDILKIILENVIIHSKCKPEDVDLQVNITYAHESNFVSIETSHVLGDTFDIGNLHSKLRLYRDNWNVKEFYGDRISEEGGSGLKKLKRILEYELQWQNNNFDYSIQEMRLSMILSFKITLWNEKHFDN